MGWFVLFVVMLCFSVSTSQDNLVPGISITANSTLISSSKIFALGFFSPGNSGKHFLGIWYITYLKSTTVWVANRESPLDSPGICMLSDDGNLVVLDETRKVIWSTNASLSTLAKSNTTATLQDTGNLVLTYGKQTLWESFNFPTDTVVPGMKIGFNKRTSQQWHLTSWAASDDPRSGEFRDGIDPKLPAQLLTWKKNVPFWRSGVYISNGNSSLYGGPYGEFYTIGTSSSYFSLIYNDRDDATYFAWGVSDPSVKLIVVLKPLGILELSLWNEDEKTWTQVWDPSERKKLDWDKRFRIIEGIAQGVLYIHKHSWLKIIHRDLKASNVLLDEEMNPKISDFGMARIFGVNQTEEKTNRVVGTYGYMSPEYARYGHFSEKSDVFSFGVLLLEIVSGKKNGSIHCSEDSPTLAQWAWKLWKEGRGIEAVDASMGITSQTHEALKCLQVGFLCVQEAPADRPTMATVILMLQGMKPTPFQLLKNQPFQYIPSILVLLKYLRFCQTMHSPLVSQQLDRVK